VNQPQTQIQPEAQVAAQSPDQSMLPQVLWFGFFIALMFLLPPLVAMDLAIP
jgi:hypothetical protein